MGKITGFLESRTRDPDKRPAKERVRDYREFELPIVKETLQGQGRVAWIAASRFATRAVRSAT